MDREEVLALLRQRIPDPEIVPLLDRRFPDTQPALELVPLALTVLAERSQEAIRLASIIPTLSEQCRTILRLRLQGMSFGEISDQIELETDAVTAYAKCRRRLFSSSKALPDYAASALSAEDRLALFEEALRNPPVFQSLKDEHTLLTLLENTGSRAKLLEATDEVRFTISGSLKEWFERPRSKVLVLLGVIALLSILVQECGRTGSRRLARSQASGSGAEQPEPLRGY